LLQRPQQDFSGDRSNPPPCFVRGGGAERPRALKLDHSMYL
jgi:hypothetical protein